jgi:hypothetical protein
MGKKLYMYQNKKKELLECYGRIFTKVKLHQHFFENRDYHKESKKDLLKEINKNYKYEFLRDDLIDYYYQGKSKKKFFKDDHDLKKELKIASPNNKVTKKNKRDILKVFRKYLHPLDYRIIKKEPKQKLEEYVKYGY